MRMIFVNLPVKNIETSRAFFTTLGFTFNPEYSDDRTLCMIVEENIFVMLLQEERFRDFINGDIADAKRSTEVLTCLSAGSREEIDRMIEAALASGGSRWKPVQDHGFMYAGSFQDPDGHVWELVHMAPQG
ncbi:MULTISPECIES: VOC family protein [Agrobacterium]|jgi:predicted lactoylglutathione lyase|uniref:Lactoylglutathione lyase n=1 Tax=Agrobacterium pusense TaxID=648995 RepID=U4PX52_9HYPH|nr:MULTISPECIES: VOC family protein [Agrobacterium]AUC10696.1 glyoxalase [Rhizobium sp. Y9]KIV64138.1 lactoylglutathione lyase [Rhizobium sp. UR51a]MDP9734335.1 putative lactoylglutathione lyase [Rhizobium sp. SORGH_AS_0285]MDP9756535.1 putative lactoylglutathione lyase [Rhizobium sp. SORGH_AS_0260]MDP9774684.1 putative lactoylglutathione lyase [Rhizobium sp. SORGH_AS_0755]OAI83472.1 glyoxalase [Rhizobium sp. GHKF11]TGR66154.1 glyoxalase [bacterium M00.F.Ca.ET.194.01.1.1]TGS53125.1 glyoxala